MCTRCALAYYVQQPQTKNQQEPFSPPPRWGREVGVRTTPTPLPQGLIQDRVFQAAFAA